MVRFQTLKTPKGEELVVLSRDDFERFRAGAFTPAILAEFDNL